MLNKKPNINRVMIIKPMNDPRVRYITAKKLAEVCPEKPFMDWKAKLDAMVPIIMKSSQISIGLNELKDALVSIEAKVEIVQQKTIGGKQVF